MTPDEQRLTELNEGRSSKIYTDSVGKLTGGVGHNFTDRGIPGPVIDQLLALDYAAAESGVSRALPWVSALDPVVRAVVNDLVFNMGLTKTLRFRDTLAALRAGDRAAAAKHLRASIWFQQVGVRGPRMLRMLETGKWPWQE
jgi:lysozyme